jgi:carboxyl-terminal processing protease
MHRLDLLALGPLQAVLNAFSSNLPNTSQICPRQGFRLRPVIMVALALSLIACGGGGGGNQASATPFNTAPTIVNPGVLSIPTGTTAVTTIVATDAQGQNIAFNLLGVDAAMLSITNGGSVSFRSAPNFNNPQDANADNMYQIIVQASDGTAASTLAMNIAVTNSAAFAPARNFANLCGEPRTGTDPSSNIPYPDLQGTFADENNFLRSWSNDQYLWYEEIEDVNPLTNADSSQDVEDYFDLMRTFAKTPSGADRDRFHFSIDTEEWNSFTSSGATVGYGANFVLLSSTRPRSVVVSFVEANTSASSASINLSRGAQIISADGVDIELGTDTATLNSALFPSNAGETHEFEIRDLGAASTRTISMTTSAITVEPVPLYKVVATPSGPVGYLQFNDHIATAEEELFDAITDLAAANINDLVLDLRYNGGGYLIVANQLAYMIAGPNARNQVFESLTFNDKYPNINPVSRAALQPALFEEKTVGLTLTAGTDLPTLGLNRVFVLTGKGTCSASESIINGLRGINVEVVQIGTTTCGKPYGFYPRENCGTTYFSTQFQGVNAVGFGDYPDGFSPQNLNVVEGVAIPGCSVEDDFSQLLGNENEALFAAALAYRTAPGTCPELPAGISPLRQQNLIKQLPGRFQDSSNMLDNRGLVGKFLRPNSLR